MKPLTFVGLHIPKCAGTTLLNRVQSCLPSDQVFQNTSIIRNYQQQKEDFLHITGKRRLRFVWGHTIHEEILKFFGSDFVLITGLREPMERFNSELRYMVRLARDQNRPRPDIAAHIRAVHNPMCRFLVERFPTIAGKVGTLADRAINVIEAFNFIYFSDTFEETAGAIFKAMRLNPRPVSSNVAVDSSSETFDVNPANHQFDRIMYERAQNLFRGVSPDRSFAKINPRLSSFVASPANVRELRDFMWKSSYFEYRNWNALEKVIDQKQSQIDELSYEIAFYQKFCGGSSET